MQLMHQLTSVVSKYELLHTFVCFAVFVYTFILWNGTKGETKIDRRNIAKISLKMWALIFTAKWDSVVIRTGELNMYHHSMKY